MNKVIEIGRAVAEPEYRQTASGIPVTKFRMAVNRRYKNTEGKYEADFFDVICWRGLADLVKMYLAKGDRCAVIGSLQTRSYDDKNGVKRYITEIVADEVEFLNSKPKEDAPAQSEVPQYQPPQYQQTGFTQVEDDELPF